MNDDGYAFGEVPRLAGITVRKLHHYDDLTLMPSTRTAAGHRRDSTPGLTSGSTAPDHPEDADATHAAMTADGMRLDMTLQAPGVPPPFSFRELDGNAFSITENA